MINLFKNLTIVIDRGEPRLDLKDALIYELRLLIDNEAPENTIPVALRHMLIMNWSYDLSIFHIFDIINILKRSKQYPLKRTTGGSQPIASLHTTTD
jgi:hypothetical protein